MFDIFDFDGDGKTSFEEETLGMMLVMSAFDEKETNVNKDLFDDDEDADEDFWQE